MDDTLRTCHPAVSFAYFALVIACAMLLMHPVCLVLSTLGGGWYVAVCWAARACAATCCGCCPWPSWRRP